MAVDARQILRNIQNSRVASPAGSLASLLGTVPIALTDGITAPATVSGVAQIYVDVADGDLKVKFGDGTVKTIVTDT